MIGSELAENFSSSSLKSLTRLTFDIRGETHSISFGGSTGYWDTDTGEYIDGGPTSVMGMEEFRKTLGPSCEGNATTYRGSEKFGESEGNKVVFVECEFFCARCTVLYRGR